MREEITRRIKAAHGDNSGRISNSLLILLVVVIAAAAIILYLTRPVPDRVQTSQAQLAPAAGKKAKGDRPFAGTAFRSSKEYEASGAIQVPGTDTVLFIDDGKPDEVFLMKIDAAGQQVGDIKPLKLGVSVENPEGITFDGSYFYIVGSQASPKKSERNGLVRFKFDQNSQSVNGAEMIRDLRGLLISKVPELSGEGARKGEDGGLNIEGIAFDPAQKRLLLGLRSPFIAGQALIIPLKLGDPAGPFSADNISFADAPAIKLALGGAGIRDIQYDSKLQSFLLISGAPENQDKGEFTLWQWDGSSGAAQPQQRAVLDSKMKPEGITQISMNGSDFIFIVGDASRYLKFDYTD